MGFFFIIFTLFVKCFRAPTLVIALSTHKHRTMLINGLLLITNYMYEDFLIQIKDYPI